MKALKILTILSILALTQAFGAITGSKHDLQSTSSNTIKSTDTTEICVFCHTPHGSNTAFDGAPLWNKATPSGVTYTMYGTTLGGTGTDAAPSNSSKACLSCHDGVSAINSVVNAPGSGLGSGTVTMATTTMPDTSITNIGEFGTGAGTNVNLSNDHPVSIIYDATKASLRPTTETVAIAGWVTPVGTAGAISNLLRNDRVECSSCHDPHLGPEAGQELFLRSGTNTGSQLCLGCHNK